MVGFAAVTLAMTAPGQTIGVSVFVDPIISDLGITRSQLSVAYLVGTLAGALLLPWVGRSIDRAGVRRAMVVIGALFGLALAGMSLVRGLVTLALGFVGIRMLGQGSLSLASTTSVALWFDRQRGLATGLTNSVGGALMSLSPLVLAQVVARLGWRATWVVTAIAVWAVVVPIGLWGVRDAPGSVGHAKDDARAGGTDAIARAVRASWTRREASRTVMFWAVAGAMATTYMITTGLAFHQISVLGERGLTTAQAAANFIPQSAAAIVTTLLMGALVDRLPERLLLVASMGALAAALLLVQVAAPGVLAIVYGIAAGTSVGFLRAQEAALLPRFFGVRHLAEIRGFALAIGVGGTSIGPLLLAAGFERASSYGPVLTGLVALPAAIAVVLLLAPIPDDALLERVRRARGRAR